MNEFATVSHTCEKKPFSASSREHISADFLSEKAKELEMAARNQDEGFIREHHEGFLLEYDRMTGSIWDVFAMDSAVSGQPVSGGGQEISKEELLLRLAGLKEGLDTFEADKAESILSEISTAVYAGTSVGCLLSDVQKDLDDFEFMPASEKLEAFIKKVEGGEVG